MNALDQDVCFSFGFLTGSRQPTPVRMAPRGLVYRGLVMKGGGAGTGPSHGPLPLVQGSAQPASWAGRVPTGRGAPEHEKDGVAHRGAPRPHARMERASEEIRQLLLSPNGGRIQLSPRLQFRGGQAGDRPGRGQLWVTFGSLGPAFSPPQPQHYWWES